jgi:hypothetical protein
LEDPSKHEIYDYGLFLINENLINDYNTSLDNIGSMPQFVINCALHHSNPLIAKQFNWNLEDFMTIVTECVPQLNVEQIVAY